MINKQEKLTKVKLKGNESFNIREGWLRKGMRCVRKEKTLFSKEDAMETLGVGSKMVKSIRYWLRATGLTEENAPVGRAREQIITEKFGEIVERYDPYFDDVFTLFLLHYNIVKDSEGLSIVWNIFFNNYDGQDFTKENMIVKHVGMFNLNSMKINANYSALFYNRLRFLSIHKFPGKIKRDRTEVQPLLCLGIT